MKIISKYIAALLSFFTVAFILNGCEQMEEVYPPTDYISFKATLGSSEKQVKRTGFNEAFTIEEEEWEITASSIARTKAPSLLASLNEIDAKVYGYVYNGDWSNEKSPWVKLNGIPYEFDGDQMVTTGAPIRWSTIPDKDEVGNTIEKIRIFAYALDTKLLDEGKTLPDGISLSYEGGSTEKGAPVIEESNVSKRVTDIVVADKEVSANYNQSISLDFEHIYTAIQFKAGFDCTVKSLTIENIQTSGNYTIGEGWEYTGISTYTMDLPAEGLSVTKDENIGELILMLPQTLVEDASIKVELSDGETLSAELDNIEWKQGKRITYTLRKKSEKDNIIYFDLAAGNITINENYTGYVFVNKEAKEISGTHSSGNKYYVYQSCITDANKDNGNYKVGYTIYNEEDKKASGTFTLPSYSPVKTQIGTLWADFITNNSSVENVIEEWDSAGGVIYDVKFQNIKEHPKYSQIFIPDGEGSIDKTKAVRIVNRESTKNYINIEGEVGDCQLTIDNIYSTAQKKGGHNRAWGSIVFIPKWGSESTLHLNIIGDNRLGCIHYNNNTGDGYGSVDTKKQNKNFLIFEGSGTLTVTDADFYKNNDRENTGYYSNHFDSAIGNSDGSNATYGIIIKSGVIFAGTTLSENCSAIGAGGNGFGDVKIEGGTVTAVASTTGAAIGGGIGFSDTGGEGYVEITGGNVFAYNHGYTYKNGSVRDSIPSSAIGGAGSSSKKGSMGTVIISGGNVYAESGLGTAIGGGSSATKSGGKAVVTISGGQVIAKSKTFSAGIGGGSSYTQKYSPNNGDTKNGGDAEITITGNPIIRTGSIGGGSPGEGKADGGKIGSAVVNIDGGDIQAQFVMADSDGNVFTMDGGLIRNSRTSDEEYKCIQPNGAAVYMEKGKFTMTGGTIRECKADKEGANAKGGAVYIKGNENTSFTMKGGTIEECMADTDGGAVYLEGGTVKLLGGTIIGNVAYNGNGGGISIKGGNFYLGEMDGGTLKGNAEITQNASLNKSYGGTAGNGGGVYVAPASGTDASTINVNLLMGSITENSAERYGGGICVDMGGNNKAELNVIVGNESDGENTSVPDISSNNALNDGGGMYVNGAKASVILYNGNMNGNSTSSYRVNEDIKVADGEVTLMKSGITTQATITFNNNAQYYDSSKTDETKVQYVVAASKSGLEANTFTQINDYYNTFKEWNTRRDGNGKSYTDKQIETFNENITLYAQWE